jgi:hypothetical protein
VPTCRSSIMSKKRLAFWLCLLLFVCGLKSPGAEIRNRATALAFQAAPLIINEYLADPASGATGDANGDGVFSTTQDEFVELVNTGSAPLDIGGFTVSDALQVRFTVPANKIIPPGEAAVVFGGGVPAGAFGNAGANGLVFAIGGAGLSLNNAGDSIIIKNSSGVEVARHDYPPPASDIDQSLTRSPDITGGFTAHSSAAGSEGRLFSPGARVNNRPFVTDDPAITSITPEAIIATTDAVIVNITGSNFQSGSQARIDGATVNTTFISETALAANIAPPVTSTPARYGLTVQNPDSTVSNAVTFTVFGGIGINEFLADPPDGAAGDANGDGTRSATQDEFIEIVNRTSAALPVGGFTVSDADQTRFTFPSNAIIPAGEVAVIFGGGSPQGEFGNARANGLVFTSALSLDNGGDTITLKDNLGNTVELVTYGASEGSANQSITRNPEIIGTGFAPHSTIGGSGGRLFSPGAMVNGSAFTTGPRIARITPDRVPFDSPPFDLSVEGSGFEVESNVLIDSAPVDTRFISAGELIATVPESVIDIIGSHSVEVRNQGGNRSNIVTLTITPPPPVLLLVLPRLVNVGTGNFTLFASGENFDAASVIVVEDTPLVTALAISGELKATVPASFTATLGVRRVRVRNSDGQESREQAFEVVLPSGRVTSITPSQAVAGGPQFTLTVTGTNFRDGAVTIFDQTLLPTRVVSATVIQSEVAAPLIAMPGLKGVKVQNADGTISNEVIFRIAPLAPIIHSIDPPAIIEGSPDQNITIIGERFQPGAAARIVEPSGPRQKLDTVFAGSERLEVAIKAEMVRVAGKLLIRVENPDSGISNNAALNISIKNPLIINEYLADPPEGAAGDANGDGTRSTTQDEFVEIVNRTSDAIDLSGYKLSDADAVRHVFAAETVLPPFEAAIVFGGGTAMGRFGNAAENNLVFRASSGGLSLNNGGDRVRLEDAAGRLVEEIKFGAAEGGANQSINRDPDVDGATFSLHTVVAGAGILFSPGTRAAGQAFTIKPLIHALAPASIRRASEAFTLKVVGASFTAGANVLFGQAQLETLFVSETELEARVGAELITIGGAIDVRVRNPKGEISSITKFVVFDDPPRIVEITPQKIGTLAEAIEIALTGEAFQPGAIVLIRDEAVETVFINARLLHARPAARFFTRAASLEIRALNADGNRSNALTLEVENGPLITRLSRSKVRAGKGAFEISIGGVAFKPGAKIFVDDAAIETSFVSETELRARIPAELTAAPGHLTLQVRNPDGGRSNKVTVKVVE